MNPIFFNISIDETKISSEFFFRRLYFMLKILATIYGIHPKLPGVSTYIFLYFIQSFRHNILLQKLVWHWRRIESFLFFYQNF